MLRRNSAFADTIAPNAILLRKPLRARACPPPIVFVAPAPIAAPNMAGLIYSAVTSAAPGERLPMMTIGRAPGCDYLLSSTSAPLSMSRVHALVHSDGIQVFIEVTAPNFASLVALDCCRCRLSGAARRRRRLTRKSWRRPACALVRVQRGCGGPRLALQSSRRCRTRPSMSPSTMAWIVALGAAP
jgi:hypothetical protein